MSSRLAISSGSPWEDIVGYSRALRVGNTVYVAGTTAVDQDGNVVGENDLGEQTRFILQKILSILKEAGARPEDVVRTRMYVTDISRWEDAGRVHGEFFREIRPVATMVEVQQLISPELLIEIEVEAIIGE